MEEEDSPRPKITEFIGHIPPGIRFPQYTPAFYAVSSTEEQVKEEEASETPLTPFSGIVDFGTPSSPEPLKRNADPEQKEPVSWNWNGSHPSGTAAEVKAGEVTVTSHRGNEISKTGDESNPAVHIERSGNDVVKTANELNVDKKAEGSSTNGNGNTNGESKQEEKKDEKMKDADKDESKDEKKDEGKEDEKKDEAQTGDKRKADEKVDAAEEKKEEGNGDDAKKQKTTNGTDASTANGDKKKPGRPKAGANGEKKAAPKKEKKQPAVGKAQRKTRSQAKADGE